MRIALLLLLLFPAWLYATEVYKTIAPDGSVIYSDQPSSDADRIPIEPAPTLAPLPQRSNSDRPPPSPSENSAPAPTRHDYESIQIVSPTDDQTIRDNPGRLTLQVLVRPGLDVQAGDRLAVSIDGVRLEGRFTGETLSLKNVDRGTHHLVVEVMNSQGEVIVSSAPVTIHMKRHSILNPSIAPK